MFKNHRDCTSGARCFRSARGQALAVTWNLGPQLPPVTRLQIQHPGAVAIVAQPQPESLVMVHQFRYALHAWTWEVPAGTQGVGESWLATAQRELREEAGFRAESFERLQEVLPAPGMTDEVLSLVRASELTATSSECSLMKCCRLRSCHVPKSISSYAMARFATPRRCWRWLILGGGHVAKRAPWLRQVAGSSA